MTDEQQPFSTTDGDPQPFNTTGAQQAFIASVNKQYKSNIASSGDGVRALDIPRFSSGILSLDLALGGGWPFSRIALLAGEESTGKTLIALRAASSLKDYCKVCHLHSTRCQCETFTPCTTLFVDIEGTFDPTWATLNGYDLDANTHVRPDYAEQAVDIIDAAIESGTFDLVIVDSLAALTPTKEIEDSAESNQVGLAARLLNKAFRKWVSSLSRVSNKGGAKPPALLCLNQLREKVGVMFGDPRTTPGGRGQLFAASVIVWTKAVKYADDPDKLTAIVELGGVTKKNKTHVPKLTYECKLALKDFGEVCAGHINNEDLLVKKGQQYALIGKDNTDFFFPDLRVGHMRARLREDYDLSTKLWQQIVQLECSVDV